MYHHALVQEATVQEGTFLAALSPTARTRLLADAVVLEVAAGAPIYSATSPRDRAGIILTGMARTHLSAGDGRRLSVRFARAGTMIGTVRDGHNILSVQAVLACTVLELNLATLTALVAEDGQAALALLAEITRRLRDTYATLASNTFGTMRERVARHLLDLATEATHSELLVAPVTQQGLADGVGTVREVVARVLRDFRKEGLVATADGRIELLDPDALASIVGRSRSISPAER